MDGNIENLINEDEVSCAEEDTASEKQEAVSEATVKEGGESLPEKTEIVGVRFKKEGKTYYFAPNGFTLKADDRVIVDTSRGQEYGYVAVANRLAKTSELVMPLRDVVRIATEDDNRIHSENVKKEVEAYNACIALIDEHNPKMKLIDVEYAFDRTKMIFYFSAEERVDFREIVKALATMFRTRIEMRQIGIRDEAKMLGGLGVCGRPFCCSAFLTDFVQVSVKMAKEQNISLNAAKISGACGKLMCCLRYEYDTYVAEKALTPKVGSRVVTPDGPGEVIDANPLAGIVKVRHDGKPEDSETVIYVREDVVKEEDYNGEKLVKTEIPKRGKNKESEDVFSSFAISQNTSAAAPEVKKESAPQKIAKTESPAPDRKPTQENGVQVKKEESQEIENFGDGRHSGKNGKRHKKKHKGHGGQNGQNNQNGQNTQAQNAQGQNAQSQNQAGQGKSGQNGGQGPAPQKQGGQGEHNKGAQNQGGQNGHQGGQGNNHGGHHKKKHFKPYHKKFDNGGNQNGGNQNGGQA